MKFIANGVVTVSCYTEIEAESAEEAKEIAESRELAGLCHTPFTGEIDEEWHFDSDGEPSEIEIEQD